jgi:Tol biopolymer transport system component
VSSFDRKVLLIVAGLIALIGCIILSGDHVGVTIVRVNPVGVTTSTTSITLQFSEDMNRDSVVQRFRIEPPVKGRTTWTGANFNFAPEAPLRQGQSYSIILERGAQSQTGRQLLSDYQAQFIIRSARTAFLAPADGRPANIWAVDLTVPGNPQQITFSQTGITEFDVSQDGSKIAFIEKGATSALKLLDLSSGSIQQLTSCNDSTCMEPAWRPDGTIIAYSRAFTNSNLNRSLSVGAGLRGGLPRVWLVDLTQSPTSDRPLFTDSQVIGGAPTWSADGSRIAVNNLDNGDITVYDFTLAQSMLIPNPYGPPGTFSADGTQVIFSKMVAGDNAGQGFHAHLQAFNLNTQELTDLSRAEKVSVDDTLAVWQPNGSLIAVLRRYNDDRSVLGRQVYLLNPVTGTVKSLVVDKTYNTVKIIWNANGDQLLLERFPAVEQNGQLVSQGLPEVWIFDMRSNLLTRMATNASHAHWLP